MSTHITAIKTTLPNSRKKKKKDILPSYQTTQTNHKREESVRRKREWVSATRTGLRNCSALNELKPTIGRLDRGKEAVILKVFNEL